MRTFDFSPLFRSTVGFDRVTRLLDSALQQDEGVTYPPYNIEKLGDDQYRITMAVAGFGEEDIEIVSSENSLTVRGKARAPGNDTPSFLYRGIAGRAFERRFQLADYIQVKGASLMNGLLHIDLVREVPEALKPRTIAVTSGAPRQAPQALDQKAAA